MDRSLKVGIGGLGNVGRQVADALARDALPGVEVRAVTARDLDRARSHCQSRGLQAAVVSPDMLPEHAQIIVECATYESFREIVEPALRAGRHVIAVSVGALACNLDLIELAERHSGCLQIATGALPGLDALRCAAEGEIESVILTSHIRPDSLARERYVLERGHDFTHEPSQPVHIFAGTAREAAAAFPRHFNVGIALALAGIGLDRTRVEIYAAPGLPGAHHELTVEADMMSLKLSAQNYPSPVNNRTSRAVAPSILAALRSASSSLRVGS